MKIITKKDIFEKLDYDKMLELQEEGFKQHFEGNVNQPPVGQLSLPKGSLHIKYAHLKNDKNFVIKLATGFPENPKKNLSSSDGCFLVFCSDTGVLTHTLFDEGFLTDCRTVLAPSLIIKNFLKPLPKKIAILGTGRIAEHLAIALNKTLGFRNFVFLGRNSKTLLQIQKNLKTKKLLADTRLYSKEAFDYLAKNCEAIITTTSARNFILPYKANFNNHLIIALGSDEEGKQELDPLFLKQADFLISDDKKQSLAHGEFQYLKNTDKKVFELGQVLNKPSLLNKAKALKIFDLTGMGIQDVQIVKELLN